MKAAPAFRRPFRLFVTGMLAGLLLLVGSCRSVPSPEDPAWRNLPGRLPPESDIVIRMMVPGNEELAGRLLAGTGADEDQLAEVISRAMLVVVGVELGGEVPALHLATIGSWPRGVMGSVLGDGWEKVARHRWNGPDGLELAMPGKDELILSAGQADRMVERAAAGAVSPFSSAGGSLPQEPDLAVWIVNPSVFTGTEGMMGMLAGTGPAIAEMGVFLRRNGDGSYALRLTLRPAEASDTGRFALAMRLVMSARFGLSRVAAERELLKDMAIGPEAGEVVLAMPAVSPDILMSLLDEMALIPGGEA